MSQPKPTDPEVRKLVDWCTENGWTCQLAHSGHFLLTHRNGGRVTVPNTPSDRRALLNTWADIRRTGGTAPPKPNAGKYRHTGQRMPRFSLDLVEQDRQRRRERMERQRALAEQLHERHARYAAALADLATDPKRDDLERARWLIRQLQNIAQACERMGFPVAEAFSDEG